MSHSNLFASPFASSSRLLDPDFAADVDVAPSAVVGPTASAVAVRMGWMRQTLATHLQESGSVPPIQERAHGEDTAVLALTWLDEEQAVFARADGDIHGVADLRGKRLGLPLRDSLASAISLRGLLSALDL